jgi:hypothetical protein
MFSAIPNKIQMTFTTDICVSKVHLETQETTNSQDNTQQKRAMLAVSQYSTSNHITKQ